MEAHAVGVGALASTAPRGRPAALRGAARKLRKMPWSPRILGASGGCSERPDNLVRRLLYPDATPRDSDEGCRGELELARGSRGASS